jgi:hypothetical protein
VGASAQKTVKVYLHPGNSKNSASPEIPLIRPLPDFRLKPVGSGGCIFPGLKPGVKQTESSDDLSEI